MQQIKALLLERVNIAAKQDLLSAGCSHVEYIDHSISKEELMRILPEYHILGIRSNTKVDEEVLGCANNLMAIGCFCIGTNQVDLQAAKKRGVVVFNSPYANTRSVAELVIAEIVFLMRGISYRDKQAHDGVWLKNATDSFEVRGKTLGIVGYGNIGSQVGLLAESMGMRVVFFDIENKLPLGNAKACRRLQALLSEADVVSLHVPKTQATASMMNAKNLNSMRKGSYLINAARGDIVDINALRDCLKSGHIKGAAIDVFPSEPLSNDGPFVSPLQNMQNVILTPHIGGSTQESQHNIALDVATKLVEFISYGSTLAAVNFPNLHATALMDGHVRLLHTHVNQPGILNQINSIFAEHNINVESFVLQTDTNIGYALIDIEGKYASKEIEQCEQQLASIDASIVTRVVGN